MKHLYYDLHVHSCLSPCADNDMTPANIAGMSALKGLGIVALTDHNTARNCPAFFAACREMGIVPVAGMELTTAEDIHLVCLFETLEDAMSFDAVVYGHLQKIPNRPEIFGDQIVMSERDEEQGREENLLVVATDLWVGDAIDLVRAHGGHVHPAHIDRTSGGMVAILGDVPAEYGFTVMELRNPALREQYRQKYATVKRAAMLYCSDAHSLGHISEAVNKLPLLVESREEEEIRRALFRYLRSPI